MKNLVNEIFELSKKENTSQLFNIGEHNVHVNITTQLPNVLYGYVYAGVYENGYTCINIHIDKESQFDEIQLKWFIAHEIGHIINNHLQQILKNGYSLDLFLDTESEADTFANELLGIDANTYQAILTKSINERLNDLHLFNKLSTAMIHKLRMKKVLGNTITNRSKKLVIAASIIAATEINFMNSFMNSFTLAYNKKKSK